MISVVRTAVIAGALGLSLAACSPSPNQEFSSAIWKARADGNSPERSQMIDSLMAQHPLEKMTRGEVANLLGEPTQTDKFQDWDAAYVLGPMNDYGVDYRWLLIQYNGDRVVETTVTSD